MSSDPVQPAYTPEPPQPVTSITSTAPQNLDFHTLGWEVFETLCARYGETLGHVKSAHQYGIRGQSQDGIDVLLYLHDDQPVAVQSRKISEMTAAKLRKAVDDYLEGKWAAETSGFVLATAASGSATALMDEFNVQLKRLATLEKTFELWHEASLSSALKGHPELVADFFGSGVLDVFIPGAAKEVASQALFESVERVRDDIAGLRNEVRLPAVAAPPSGLLDFVLASGSLPADIQEIMQGVRDVDAAAAAALIEHVGTDPTKARSIIRQPQSWVCEFGWSLHNALGQLAAAAGDFVAAEIAFLRAEDAAPAGERARMLIRASDAARNAEDLARAEELFGRARAIDPDHISVRLEAIVRTDKPETRLDALDALAPSTDRERSRIDLLRIDALGELGRFDEAAAVCERILLRTPDSMGALDRRAGLTLIRVRRLPPSDWVSHGVALAQTIEDSLALRDRLLNRGRSAETGGLLARAAEAEVLRGNPEEAGRLIGLAGHDEWAPVGSRRRLAQALLHSAEPQAALERLGDESTWENEDRVIAVRCLALLDDHHARVRATEISKGLLSDELFAKDAGFSMVAAASTDNAIPWPQQQYAALRADHPAIAAHLRADRLDAEGRRGEADDVLAPFADDPDILRQLVIRTLDAGKTKAGVMQAQALVDKTGLPQDRMLLARAFHDDGQRESLKVLLSMLCSDGSLPRRLRGRAFAALSNEIPAGDIGALADLTERWLDAVPDDKDAAWQRAFALAHLARWNDALAIVEKHELRASELQRAYLLSAIYGRTLPGLEAAKRIAALSDQFHRSDADLEAMFLMHATTTKEHADEGLLDRVADTLNTFEDKFPDSTAIITLKIPENDPEALLELLKEYADDPGTATRAELARGIDTGDIAVCTLAQTVGKHVGETLLRLHMLPVAFGSTGLSTAEVQSAREALGEPVIWDPTSATVSSLLDKSTADIIRTAFPGSIITASSLRECDQAVANISDHDEQKFISTQDGELTRSVLDGKDLERERTALRRALNLATTLTVVPDIDADHPDPIDEHLDTDPRLTAFNTWVSTFSVAARRGVPIFSDDRYIRLVARREGLATFGTAALLTALAATDALTEQEHDDARLALLRNGAVGMEPSGEELATLAAEDDDEVRGRWTASLRDTMGWRNEPDETIRRWLSFLRVLWRRNAATLPSWTHSVLGCARQAIPEHDLDFFAGVSALYVFFVLPPEDDPREQRRFVGTLLDNMEATPAVFARPAFTDTASLAVSLIFRSMRTTAPTRRWVIGRIVQQLPFPRDAEVLLAAHHLMGEAGA